MGEEREVRQKEKRGPQNDPAIAPAFVPSPFSLLSPFPAVGLWVRRCVRFREVRVHRHDDREAVVHGFRLHANGKNGAVEAHFEPLVGREIEGLEALAQIGAVEGGRKFLGFGQPAKERRGSRRAWTTAPASVRAGRRHPGRGQRQCGERG